MTNRKSFDSISSGSVDDWMERERRYEAKHSPWELDDNASYLDEEHRRHCEAREVRKQHEQECEVERPNYSQYEQRPVQPPTSQQFASLNRQLRSVARQMGGNKTAEKTVGIVFAIIAIIFMMIFFSIFIQILIRF